MGGGRALVGGVLAASSVPLTLAAALTVLATRPKLAAKVFGSEPNPSRHPADVGLESTDVDYAPGCNAWWVTAPSAVGSVVIVHGFETAEDPRATDPGPRVELAAVLHSAGFNALIISLGYGTGAHLHSGGALEAADIAAAVRWASASADVPVAVFGFSAGGHAAVAAANQMDVFAVVTDSSFVDFGEVVIDQGASVLSMPPWLFGPVRRVMKLATGHAPVDLEAWPVDRSTPMLHIHGDADQAIGFTNLARMAAVTGGETLVVGGADHIESLLVDRERYCAAVLGFLNSCLST